jgi:hypothetical protein
MKWEYVYVQELLRSRFFEIIIVKRLKETFFVNYIKNSLPFSFIIADDQLEKYERERERERERDVERETNILEGGRRLRRKACKEINKLSAITVGKKFVRPYWPNLLNVNPATTTRDIIFWSISYV